MIRHSPQILRLSKTTVLALGVLTGASNASSADGPSQEPLGFVFSHFSYSLGPDAKESGACPNGMSQGPTDLFKKTPGGAQRTGESDQDYTRRVAEGARSVSVAPNGQNVCVNPEASAPDPNYQVVKGTKIKLEGLDLHSQEPKGKSSALGDGCAHEEFESIDGKGRIANQFYRVVGCSESFQSTGSGNTFEIEMFTGSWGILLTLKGAGDKRNAADVEVGIYANADPITLSPNREPLAYATYAIDPDPRFRAVTHGRIENGVLTTDPVAVRFHWIVNSIRLERPLRDARIRATLNPDGSVEGYLAGYTPVDAIYDLQFGFRDGKDGKGAPANPKLISGSANGAAAVMHHTCNGVYYAFKQSADGHRDPKTGQCTSVSTQYKFKAIPAFVVEASTQNSN